jgi:hypothetical protein
MRLHQIAVGVLGLACAATVAACASQQTQTQTQSPPSVVASKTPATATDAVTSCSTAQLTVTLTNTGALAGEAGGYLKFTNNTSATCRITGYPSVAGVTSTGRATAFRQARATMFGAWQYSTPLPVVTLRPGDSAYAVVAAPDHPAGTQSSCPSPDVHLRVAAPGSSSTTVISAWLPGAGTYLPTCASINGTPVDETSTVTTLSALPH